MPKITYQADHRIDHVAGRVLAPGDMIHLDEDDQLTQQHLIMAGALVPVESEGVDVDLSSMSKAELREYALETFQATLEPSLNRNQLLEAIGDLEAERVGSVATGKDDGLPDDARNGDEAQG